MKTWEMFETLNEYVYVSDPKTYELIYMNKKCRELCHVGAKEKLQGRKCYQVLQQCGRPCAMCNNSRLHLNQFCEWYFYNPVWDKNMAIKDTLIEEDGHVYRLEIAIDIDPAEWKANRVQGPEDLHAVANQGLRIALDKRTPDESIQTILEFLGRMLNSDRTYVFEKNTRGNEDNTYEWVKEGIASEKDGLQDIPTEVCANWYEGFKKQKFIYIPDVDELKDDDFDMYEILSRQNIKTLFVVPLNDGEKTIGFFGVDNPKHSSLEIISDILHMMASFIVASIKRRNLLIQVQKEESNRAMAKMALQTQEYLDMVNDIIGSGLWMIEFDPDGEMKKVRWSTRFCNMIGFSDQSEFPQKLESWTDRIHPDYKDQVTKAFWACVHQGQGGTYDQRYPLLKKDGTYDWYHDAGKIAMHENGKPRLFLGTFINITKEHQAQEALQAAVDNANRANEAKTSFLSNISHDIRTPLNGIMGMLEIEERSRQDPAKLAECHKKIRASAEQLLSLVNDVLDMSRLESGSVQYASEACDIRKLIEECISITEVQANRRQVRVDLQVLNLEHPYVFCSPVHIRQIVLNILTNAIKYNKSEGSVIIRLKELRLDGSQAIFRLSVEDTGIGISKDFLPHIFEAFTQADSHTRTQYQGTGLGLPIAKSTAEQLGGSISVSSREGLGSTFTVTLPLPVDFERENRMMQKAHCPSCTSKVCLSDEKTAHMKEDLPCDDQKEQDSSQLQGMRILLAEDNELNMEIAQFILEEEGAEVIPAVNGREAFETFLESPAKSLDLILMDLMMPEMGGLEACRKIRDSNKEDASIIPIVAMTANAFASDIQNCLDAGMNGHIAKPLDMEAVVSKITHYVNESKNLLA